MPNCWHCKAEFKTAHHDRVVYNKTALYGPWEGWRMAGRYLVAPDGARLTPERVRGLLWRETAVRQKVDAAPPTRPATLPPRELFSGSA